jgi:3-hydroxy-9,10-secoandrosta-1,3,5(10)-triene-9,17-dione monooxygenase reductase component
MAVEATRKDAAAQEVGFDAAGFRRALGSFATGVTIITTRSADGQPLGLTANSFNSVSLNPPLVLWSLANSSRSLDAFRKAEYWAVHILATHQEALSGRFARTGEDKFAGLAVDQGIGGIPLLHDCTARFQCRTAFQYEGGDHIIFVGEVLDFDWTETAPLVFHGGRYAHATRRDPPGALPRHAEIAGSFSEDFLGYLLGRAHFRFYARIRPLLQQEQLSDEQFFVLSTLTLKKSVSDASLGQGLAGILDEGSRQALAELLERGFVRSTSGSEAGHAAYELTETGAACAVRVISAAKSVESEVLEKLGAADSPALKLLLNRLLTVIDPEAVAMWGEPPSGKQ